MDAHSHKMKNVSDKIKVEVKDKNGNATATLNGPIPSYDKNNNKLSVEWKKLTLKDKDQLSPLKLLNVKFIADKKKYGEPVVKMDTRHL